MRQPVRLLASDRDRLAALEKRADAHDTILTPMAAQLAEIYAIFTAAKTINWFLVKVCVVAGGAVGFVAAMLAAVSTILRLATGH